MLALSMARARTAVHIGSYSLVKTTISVPDPVYEAGERMARRLGISRSHLYSKALREYLERHDEEETTRRLNEVYATESSEPDPMVSKIAAQSLPKESWK
jgi:antitoxin MazE6